MKNFYIAKFKNSFFEGENLVDFMNLFDFINL